MWCDGQARPSLPVGPKAWLQVAAHGQRDGVSASDGGAVPIPLTVAPSVGAAPFDAPLAGRRGACHLGAWSGARSSRRSGRHDRAEHLFRHRVSTGDLREKFDADFAIGAPNYPAFSHGTADPDQNMIGQVLRSLYCNACATGRNVEDRACALDASHLHPRHDVHRLPRSLAPRLVPYSLLESPVCKQLGAWSSWESKHRSVPDCLSARLELIC